MWQMNFNLILLVFLKIIEKTKNFKLKTCSFNHELSQSVTIRFKVLGKHFLRMLKEVVNPLNVFHDFKEFIKCI